MIILKNRLEDYTESEFLELLESLFSNPENLKGKELDKHFDIVVTHFEKITEHPDQSDVIFYPKKGREDSRNFTGN
jgi:hypothetical protein